MPGLIRKLVIFAAKDGLVLQSHGSEQHQAVKVDYRTQRIFPQSKAELKSLKHDGQLECHGIIGMINIASLYFLIAITRREQVAQVFGKPIYTIADVAILPLTSQADAHEAILAASQSQRGDDSISDSDLSDSEDDRNSTTAHEPPGSPGEDDGPYMHKNKSNTSIAEDVAKRKASYGQFASRWFSKQVWGSNKGQGRDDRNSRTTASAEPTKSSIELQDYSASAAAETNEESKEETADKETLTASSESLKKASAVSLLPRILRSTKMILSSRSFYFAYDFDLTRRFSLQEKRSYVVARESLDPLFFWNRRLGSVFLDASQDAFLTPVIQGFVGQREFTVSAGHKAKAESEAGNVVQADSSDVVSAETDANRSYLLTLISRRSVKRAGLRYLRRGIDDEGNCANTVETEQILSSPTWASDSTIRSFIQIRGSIPLYFSQSPYSLKPVPMLHNSPSANQTAFRKHFQDLNNRYGTVQIAVLVDKHGTEVTIGNAYEKQYHELHDAGQLSQVNFEWFDFHSECRGMKFENVQILVNKFAEDISAWGETIITNDIIQKKQNGIIRTNCMDCLDRTNVAQSAFGQLILQRNLEEDGYTIDLLHDESTNWFNVLWADNGDAISRQYASTAALKGDFTRTRKRNWRGQMNDLGLTLSRYYSNMVNDYFSQAVIDILVGNVSWRIFEDFESSMMSADPGISVESAREAAIDNCAKIVIQDSDEDLIHGWTMLTPAHENTLRTLPFEETVVLLTDAAIYCCKFDWNTEKVASFEKVDLRSISKIRLGTYITSTFTERQLDEQLNQGLVIVFVPGNGDIIRVNTRSLQNSVNPDARNQSSTDGGAGILSWFSSKNASQTSRTLALKVIPQNATVEVDEDQATKKDAMPYNIAKRISEEIERAVIGPTDTQGQPGFIEEGDIISAADAKRRTGYLEQLGHSIKKMVWA